ncbi:gamma-glutamyl-phosphate reductase, partial [Candidatus Falkowbacteria bacterium]|nr:gamma-glutamyl-phosphate reductase [Candidatus Falkowbacteria bacterium]
MTDTQDIAALIDEMGRAARAAATDLAFAPASQRARALELAADVVEMKRGAIMSANARDLAYGRDKGLSPAMMDRLMLDEARIAGIVAGLRAVAAQPDPLGAVLAEWDMPSGLHIRRVRTPLGV